MSDDKLPFEQEDHNEGDRQEVTTGSYGDPNTPIDPNSIPKEMRSFVKAKDENASGEEYDDVSILRGFNSDDDDPDENTMLPPDDSEDPVSANVIGTNVATNKKIVTPNKVEKSVFDRSDDPLPVSEDEVVHAGSFMELMQHVRSITDYRPIELLSRGYLYPKQSVFSSGKVLVRGMRAEEEEIMMSPNLIKDGDAIEMLLKRCVILEDSTKLRDPAELLVQDRTFLLITIRGLTYGVDYDASFNCQICGNGFEVSIDLDSDLDHAFCEDPDISEPIQTILPHSKVSVGFTLPRGKDDLIVYNYMKDRQRKKGSKVKEDALRVKAGLLVKSVGGFKGKEQIAEFLKMCSAADLRHLRSCFDYPPFGVDLSLTVECPDCSSQNETRLPMGIDFFTPSSAKVKKNEETPSYDLD